MTSSNKKNERREIVSSDFLLMVVVVGRRRHVAADVLRLWISASVGEHQNDLRWSFPHVCAHADRRKG